MTRLQSFMGIVTLLACLIVGLWASQRSPSDDLIVEIPPATRSADRTKPPVASSPDADDALIDELIRDESASPEKIAPRKLSMDDDSSNDQHPVARLLAREMPDSSAEERQIWFDELRHLPLSAVADVLKIRRSATPLMGVVGSPTTPQEISSARRSDRSFAEGTRDALQRQRAVLLQNLLNANTIGYRSIEPQLSAFPITVAEDAGALHDGLRWIGTRLNLKQGEFEITERSLDLAISGTGWFAVADSEGKIALTRNGAFQLSEQRHLELITPAGPRQVHPQVQFPEGIKNVFIDEKGTVFGRSQGIAPDDFTVIGEIQVARFFDDFALTLSDDGLYRPLAGAGEMRRLTPGEGCGSLREGMLERSNVNVEAHQHALQQIEKWLTQAASVASQDRPSSSIRDLLP